MLNGRLGRIIRTRKAATVVVLNFVSDTSEQLQGSLASGYLKRLLRNRIPPVAV